MLSLFIGWRRPVRQAFLVISIESDDLIAIVPQTAEAQSEWSAVDDTMNGESPAAFSLIENSHQHFC